MGKLFTVLKNNWLDSNLCKKNLNKEFLLFSAMIIMSSIIYVMKNISFTYIICLLVLNQRFNNFQL